MNLVEGDWFEPPANPQDRTFAALTLPDEEGRYWVRLGCQWLQVVPSYNEGLGVLRAIDDWSDRG